MSVRYRMQAWGELWKRYGQIWAHAWAHRQELAAPDLTKQEAEFLPAALSIQASPVSPIGRWVARILMALMATALLWSILGHLDIVVSADGKIIASGYTKTLAAVEVAKVKALHVQEGQSVRKGDLLVELDTRMSDSERDKAHGERQNALLQAARSQAFLKALETGQEPVLATVMGVDGGAWQQARAHLADQWRDYASKRHRLLGDIESFKQALPLLQQRENDYEELGKERDVAVHAWLERKQARLDMQRQLSDAGNQLAALTAEIRKTAQDTFNEASRVAAASAQDVLRASAHGDLLRLYAPIDGTVQQLMVHTVGGVVPAAQPLMQIVPKLASVELEAMVENKDMGFVREGQVAQVKIQTFEYTKYGTVGARVLHISRDAIQDEKRGLLYSIKVALDRPSMIIDGREMALSPGMTGTVEIKTGERRVIEYLLSPLVRHARESFDER